jgi:integrase
MKLSAFSTLWLEQLEGRVRPRTIMDYTTTCGQIVTLLGDVPISAITPRSVEMMVAESAKKYAGNTVRKQLTRLRQMLSTAVRWGWLPRNPAEGKMPLPAAAKREVKPLTPEEGQRLIDAADDYYKPVFLTALTTGLRWEELFGLRWSDLDLDSATLTVRKALWERQLGEVKSDAARRTVQLPEATVVALEGHRASCPNTKEGLVFPTPWGRPMATKTWSESVMIPTAKRAKLPDIRMHDLRHVYASLLIAKGCSPKLVQSLMGHSTIQVTFNTYGHLFPNEKAQAAAIVGDYFGSKTVATKAEEKENAR